MSKTRVHTVFLCLLLAATASADTTSVVDRFTLFGSSFYDLTFPPAFLSSGDIYQLSSGDRAILNLTSAQDLLHNDSRFFVPSLASPGQYGFLSANGAGLDETRLLWRGRPFRNQGDNRAHFELLPIRGIGSVSAATYGILDGFLSGGGIIHADPVDPEANSPVTILSYRKGYYNYEPVEFVHSRRLGANSFGILGGFFPNADGRLEHSSQTGETVYGGFTQRLNPEQKLVVSLMTVRNAVQMPFTDISRSTRRNDSDVEWRYDQHRGDGYRMNLYRSETGIEEGEGGEYGREWGLVVRMSRGVWGGMIRGAVVDGRLLAADKVYRLGEVEASFGGRFAREWLSCDISGGVTGWLPDRIGPTGFARIGGALWSGGGVYLSGKYTIDPHSPQVMFANYGTVRPVNPFDPAWGLSPDLPIKGEKLRVTRIYGGSFGVADTSRWGTIGLSLWNDRDEQSVVWGSVGDSVISPLSIQARSRIGWNGSYSGKFGYYRVFLSATGFNQTWDGFPAGGVAPLEPALRMVATVSWHRHFIENELETDIAASGFYLGGFNANTEYGVVQIGNGIPFDLRATVRIKSFTLFYGLHNLNGSSYELIPGYKMMHKEEYWGGD